MSEVVTYSSVSLSQFTYFYSSQNPASCVLLSHTLQMGSWYPERLTFSRSHSYQTEQNSHKEHSVTWNEQHLDSRLWNENA